MIIVSPLILVARFCFFFNFEGFFSAFACFLSLIPGKTGSYIRLSYYKGTLKKISFNVVIGFGSFFSRPSAEVGKNVVIGGYCILGNVTIMDDVLIASRVSIPSGKYQHGSSKVFSEDLSTSQFDKITIGSRTWIGEGAIVLSSVGDDCIISAGSIVTRPILDGFIVAGNPARPTLMRQVRNSE